MTLYFQFVTIERSKMSDLKYQQRLVGLEMIFLKAAQ